MTEQIREPPLRYRLVGLREDQCRVVLMVQLDHADALQAQESLSRSGLFEAVAVEVDAGDEGIVRE